MRIYRYVSATNPVPRLAVAVDDRAPVDIGESWPEPGPNFSSTLALIEEGPDAWARLEENARAAGEQATVDQDADGFRWCCPLDRLASLRDFLAFEDHVKRGAERRGMDVPAYWYEAPIYYKGNHRSILGPEDECEWPSYTEKLDLETELAMIVGRGGRDISTADAPAHVFGFTVFNDFSARDVQSKETTAWLGPSKGKDFANAFGPCIVTADEVGTEPDLAMACRVNGEEWGHGRSSTIHWKWADMLAHVSQSEDVWPGDVYGSGTPGGCCGLDLGRFLEPGDVVELEIERIGVLRNTIGPRPSR